MIAKDNSPIRVETEDGWIVVLQQKPWSDVYEMFIGKRENGKLFRSTINKDGYLEMIEIKEGEMVYPPTITIPGRAWDGLAAALRGITPQIDKKEVDAELKATKYHLEDLRKLVFEEPKYKIETGYVELPERRKIKSTLDEEKQIKND